MSDSSPQFDQHLSPSSMESFRNSSESGVSSAPSEGASQPSTSQPSVNLGAENSTSITSIGSANLLESASSRVTELAPAPDQTPSTSEPSLPVAPVEKTVISQQPIAGPEDFFHSMPILDMAKMLVGRQLDHYVLDELVGGGGMGAVFRGRDLRLDRVVAIKVIPAAKRDAETLRRFRVEAQSAAKLDHPNIARVYYVGEADQWSYIVFEFIEGVNLRDLVAQRGPLSVDESVCYIRQVAEALDHAQSREVVHRDIKPSNILITSQGQAKIVDMGLARSNELEKSSHDVTASGVTLGTFDYISPEQAKDPRDADVRSDLYSLGCTWYYALVARPPFPDGTALQKLLKHGSENPEDPRYVRGDLSNDLIAILFKLMAKKPADRYQQPLDLIVDLQTLARIEDLPKSQQANTILLAPSLSQRTALESILPWILASTILVVSTLWLQSMERWQSDYPLPSAKIADSGIDGALIPKKEEMAPSASNGPDSLSPESSVKNPVLPLEGTRVGGQVDGVKGEVAESSREKGANGGNGLLSSRHVTVQPGSSAVEGGTAIYGSIEEALLAAETDVSIQEIRIATNRLACGSLKIGRKGLTIRSAQGFQPKLEWASNSLPTGIASGISSEKGDKVATWIDVGNHDLVLRGIQLHANLSNDRTLWTVFRLEPSAKLELLDSTVTIENIAGTPVKSMLYGDTMGRRSGDQSETVSPPVPSSIAPLQVRIENCIFRGEAKWLSMPDVFRSEIRWSNGLLAIDDRMLDLGGSSNPSRTPVNIRLSLDNVTLSCNTELARIAIDGLRPYRVCISRDSRDCAYWLPRGEALAEIYGVEEMSQVEEMLDFRGEDNAYDDGIETIAVVTTRGGETQKVRFDGMPFEILRERGIESSVRWMETLPPSTPFHAQRPADYRQRSGDFQPGMIESLLPAY